MTAHSLQTLPESQQIVIWVQYRKFFLSPRFDFQRAIWMNGNAVVQEVSINGFDILRSNVNS